MLRDILTTPPPETQEQTEQALFEQGFITLETIEEQPVSWVINGYIPTGSITVLAGDGGSGKTFTMCDVLAGISSGKETIFETNCLPGIFDREPANVLFFSGEDSLSRVLKRRLKDAGANMERVFTVSPASELFPFIHFGSKSVAWAIEKYRPALVAFDPVQAFVDSGTEMCSRSDMRSQFAPLIALGEKYGTAFLLLVHTNKGSGYGRNRAADSSDIWDAARSFLMCGQLGGEIHVSQEKSSYGRLQPTVLGEIRQGRLVFTGSTEERDREFQKKAKGETI